jgi:hypothetical protein
LWITDSDQLKMSQNLLLQFTLQNSKRTKSSNKNQNSYTKPRNKQNPFCHFSKIISTNIKAKIFMIKNQTHWPNIFQNLHPNHKKKNPKNCAYHHQNLPRNTTKHWESSIICHWISQTGQLNIIIQKIQNCQLALQKSLYQ